jgi:hypothetical protein
MDKIKYYKKLISLVCITSGTGLLLEHLFTWGEFNLLDIPFSHDLYGLILIFIGFLVSGVWSKGEKLEDKETEDDE